MLLCVGRSAIWWPSSDLTYNMSMEAMRERETERVRERRERVWGGRHRDTERGRGTRR